MLFKKIELNCQRGYHTHIDCSNIVQCLVNVLNFQIINAAYGNNSTEHHDGVFLHTYTLYMCVSFLHLYKEGPNNPIGPSFP